MCRNADSHFVSVGKLLYDFFNIKKCPNCSMFSTDIIPLLYFKTHSNVSVLLTGSPPAASFNMLQVSVKVLTSQKQPDKHVLFSNVCIFNEKSQVA
jgi:hypothetical protein